MNARRLGLLVLIAAVLVGVAIAIRKPPNAPADNAPRDQPLLPALRDHVNDVSAITLTGPGDKVIATLARGKDGWVVAERSGYPADVTAIRDLLVKLARSTLVEPKTTNPQRYVDIGVDDVTSKDAKGVQVDIAGLSSPTRLIVGSYSAPAQGTFVRRGGEAQSWLASGDLSVPKAVTDWEKRDVVDIAAERIASVTLTPPEGKALKLSRRHPGDAVFALDDIPAARQLDQGMAATVAATLSGMRIDDVLPANEAPPPDRSYKADYSTFDGVKIQAIAWTKDGKDYAQFRASLDRGATAAKKPSPAETEPKPEALGKEVAQLDRSFSGWTYVLPGYLYASMTKASNDLLQPVKSKNAATHSRDH